MRAARLAVAYHLFDIVEAANHGNPAHRLAAVCHRRRQDADGAHPATRAALDRAQQHLGIRGTPEDERGQRVLAAYRLLCARVAELAVDRARADKKRDLHEPVEPDRDLAEEIGAVDLRRDQDVVQHKQGDRQNGGGLHDVEHVGQREKPPLRRMQAEQEIDEAGIDHEARQEPDQPVEALSEPGFLEANEEARQDGDGGRNQIMREDQVLARREGRNLEHSAFQ